jgi:hypothetical protein
MARQAARGCGSPSVASSALLLTLDLGVLHKENRRSKSARASRSPRSISALGLAFGGLSGGSSARRPGIQYLTGFVVEKSLALDNVFVIALIFGFFAVPRAVSAPRAVLGHSRRHRAARDHDRLGATLVAEFAGCSTCVRRLPDPDRRQDAGHGRQAETDLAKNPLSSSCVGASTSPTSSRRALLREAARPEDRQARTVHDAAVPGADL